MPNEILSQDQYAKIWSVECENGYLLARVDNKADLTNEVLESIEIKTGSIFWYEAHFQSLMTCTLQPHTWAATLEQLKELLNPENVEWTYPDKQEYEQVWIDLAEAGITTGYDPQVLKQAVEARLELQAAQAKYKETLKALGAEWKEDGTYEDYREWLELPGVPMCPF